MSNHDCQYFDYSGTFDWPLRPWITCPFWFDCGVRCDELMYKYPMTYHPPVYVDTVKYQLHILKFYDYERKKERE